MGFVINFRARCLTNISRYESSRACAVRDIDTLSDVPSCGDASGREFIGQPARTKAVHAGLTRR